jgi:RNA polymerase sigma-70 factor, ECF subfamily
VAAEANDKPSGGTLSALIARAQSYEPDAVSELYQCYAELIYRYIIYRVGDPNVAEDLLSDVFLSALERLPGYRDLGRPFEAWLYSIAHNKVVDYFRRQRVRKVTGLTEDLLVAPGDEPLQQMIRDDEARHAWQAVNQLTDEQQQVITLRFLGGQSIGEVAAQLGKTEGSVKQLQNRALAALRRILGVGRGS